CRGPSSRREHDGRGQHADLFVALDEHMGRRMASIGAVPGAERRSVERDDRARPGADRRTEPAAERQWRLDAVEPDERPLFRHVGLLAAGARNLWQSWT